MSFAGPARDDYLRSATSVRTMKHEQLALFQPHSMPTDFRYAPDLIDPEIDVRRDGTIAVPTGPGIGVQIVPERVIAATRETLELGH
jgi:L-alanine-DL-glutamate epimerase-like enolase superfamily enzyme